MNARNGTDPESQLVGGSAGGSQNQDLVVFTGEIGRFRHQTTIGRRANDPSHPFSVRLSYCASLPCRFVKEFYGNQ